MTGSSFIHCLSTPPYDAYISIIAACGSLPAAIASRIFCATSCGFRCSSISFSCRRLCSASSSAGVKTGRPCFASPAATFSTDSSVVNHARDRPLAKYR